MTFVTFIALSAVHDFHLATFNLYYQAVFIRESRAHRWYDLHYQLHVINSSAVISVVSYSRATSRANCLISKRDSVT
jgi:hypothetical protein